MQSLNYYCIAQDENCTSLIGPFQDWNNFSTTEGCEDCEFLCVHEHACMHAMYIHSLEDLLLLYSDIAHLYISYRVAGIFRGYINFRGNTFRKVFVDLIFVK